MGIENSRRRVKERKPDSIGSSEKVTSTCPHFFFKPYTIIYLLQGRFANQGASDREKVIHSKFYDGDDSKYMH